MNFNEKLQELREIKKQCFSDTKSIEYKKQEELEQVTKQITEKYDELSKAKYQELKEHNTEIDAYCKLIASYSYFNAKEIGCVIASLMKTFEGTNYIYQEAVYDTIEVKVLSFDKLETEVTKYPSMIIEEDSRSDRYDENLKSVIRNGKAIILAYDNPTSPIHFYRANTDIHILEQCVKFGRFSYIKDFIDEVISYKMEHILENISADELEKLKIDFISSRVLQIEENYRLIAQQQEEQFKQKLEADKKNRLLNLRKLINKKK